MRKRVCELVKGDRFQIYGTPFLVINVTDEFVIYKYIHRGWGKMRFGVNSKQIVEIIE